MQFTLSWLELVAVLLAGGGIVAGLSIAGLLFVRETGSREANVALGAFLLVTSLLVLYVLLLYVQPMGENLGIVFAPLPFTFALGPLLYAYVRARLGQGRPGWVHGVLPIAQAVLILGVALAPERTQQVYMGEVFAPWWGMVRTVIFVLSFAFYLALSWRAVRDARPLAFEWAAERNAWLRQVLRIAAVALVVAVIFNLIGPMFPRLPGQTFWGISWISFIEVLVYSAILYVVALGGWVQAGLGPGTSRELRPETERKEHYNLEPARADGHAAALAALVREEKPHLDPNLSLGSLASQLGVTDKVLSYLFNETLGTSYTEFVNGLRVDEAKARLADPANAPLTVLAVGLDAGFASKSTFNRVFKEATGETPSAFRQRAAAEREGARPDAS
ncbi:MAG TPA: AraC family transcriptional regulator [Bacteroidetes bacterium]|nr:AraC family transcriptional regulator [Bacteroidota bacterium]HIL59001.1 AraC family transcriptional regulator [Rhodothermales bacterium]